MAGGASTRVLGPYEIFEEIASGGMATVHLGRALGTDRFVAVKRMHTQFAKDADFRSMFLDEARLCAFVEHENVGRTLDVVDADGELLLILELVHGESLSRLAKQVAARGSRVPLAARWSCRRCEVSRPRTTPWARAVSRSTSCTATSLRTTCSSAATAS
jgi:serine/threonine-protein kinase